MRNLLLRQAKGFPRLVWTPKVPLLEPRMAVLPPTVRRCVRARVRVFPYRTNFSVGIPAPDIELMLCRHLPITAMRAALPASVLGLKSPVAGASWPSGDSNPVSNCYRLSCGSGGPGTCGDERLGPLIGKEINEMRTLITCDDITKPTAHRGD